MGTTTQRCEFKNVDQLRCLHNTGHAGLRDVYRDGSVAPQPAPDAEGEADMLDDPRVDKEIRRWQDAIRDKLIDLGAPDHLIDGAGCDSGDPLDFTLAEVGQGVGYFIGQLDEQRALAASVPKLVEALRGIRQWLIMPSADGVERTAWPERVAEIDAALASTQIQGKQ